MSKITVFTKDGMSFSGSTTEEQEDIISSIMQKGSPFLGYFIMHLGTKTEAIPVANISHIRIEGDANE